MTYDDDAFGGSSHGELSFRLHQTWVTAHWVAAKSTEHQVHLRVSNIHQS